MYINKFQVKLELTYCCCHEFRYNVNETHVNITQEWNIIKKFFFPFPLKLYSQ